MADDLHILFVAGEPSGDLLGAQIIRALKGLTGDHVRLSGMGGPAMEDEGLRSSYDLEATSIMGLQEALPKIPAVLKRVREVADLARDTRPDAVVLIDAPDFTHRVAKRLKKIAPDIEVIKYVAPQVWATRPWRARKLGRIIDHQLVLLPFEPAFFEGYGLATTFVGHPAVERVDLGDGGAFRSRHGIEENATVLGVLIGSRNTEFKYMAEIYLATVSNLSARLPGLHTILPTVPHLESKVRALAERWPTPVTVVVGGEEKKGAFAAMDTALATSGTVSTELAIARVPTVIAYRLGPITAAIGLRILNTKFITLINIIADKAIMPEFVQSQANPEALSGAVLELLTSDLARDQQRAEMEAALVQMGLGGEAPSVRAARAILDIVGRPET